LRPAPHAHCPCPQLGFDPAVDREFALVPEYSEIPRNPREWPSVASGTHAVLRGLRTGAVSAYRAT
jgi:hypothetical protein